MILGEPLEYAVKLLAQCCDGAMTNDNSGFNKLDAGIGKELAQKPFGSWSPQQKRMAWRMLAKYAKQLERLGVIYTEIPIPQEPEIKGAGRKIWLNGSFIRITFPYQPEMVERVKNETHRTRTWDGVNKHWLLPAYPAQAHAAVEFGVRYDFEINDLVKELADQFDPQDVAAQENGNIERREFIFEDDHVAVLFSRSEILYNAIHSVPGAKWDSKASCWRIPNTAHGLTALHAFANRFKFTGDTNRLSALAENLSEMMATAVAASSAASAEIEIEGLGGELRPFQKAGVVYGLDKKRLIIGDQMGLGKTVEALAIIQAAQAYPALVICPANLKLNWVREAHKWLPKRHLQMLGGKDSFGRHDADVTIVNYDRLKQYREYLLKRGFKAIVADESHYTKNASAARTIYVEEIFAGVSYERKDGKVDRRHRVKMSEPAEYQLLLSGSPVLNRPDELISQLRIIDRLDDLGGWKYFTSTYCDAYGTRFGYDTSGAKNLIDLNNKLRALCYVRRLKADVLKELPPKVRTVVPVEITNRREYDKAEQDLIAWLRETQGQAKADAALQAEQLVRIEALKQLAARGKMEAIKEWVKDFSESGQKLVMFAWHKEIVNDLALAFHCPRITGDTPLAVRDQSVQDFQGKPEVTRIVCNVQAGGVGITLTEASDVCFFELGWNPGTMDQAGDRCHRIGQTDSVTEWWFLGKNTIDEPIHALIEQKRNVVDQATDGTESTATFSVMNELVSRLVSGERTYDVNNDWQASAEPEERELFA